MCAFLKSTYLMIIRIIIIITNYIKAKIDNMQQNSKCRSCSDKYETIDHIIRECCKLTQREYKTRHDWVGKAIY